MIKPAAIPDKTAIKNPALYGMFRVKTMIIPAVRADTAKWLFTRKGPRRARKVRGTANSKESHEGRVFPAKTPVMVAACQVSQMGRAAPI
jgi:hypothetical protein